MFMNLLPVHFAENCFIEKDIKGFSVAPSETTTIIKVYPSMLTMKQKEN